MPQIVTPPEQEPKEHPGFQIVRWLRPGGAAIVLIIFILFLVFCFTSGRAPIKGYAPPEDAEYYAQHLDALASELNDVVLPQIDENASAEVTGDTVTVSTTHDAYVTTRAAVLKYFDRTLVEFTETP